MILTDTGPLVALINRNDPNHARCLEALRLLPAEPMLTTWPCFTEAMYLLHRAGGIAAQDALWKLYGEGRLELHESSNAEATRMAQLMADYDDLPMDLADASLVAAAETLDLHQVFTLDQDFYIYRLRDGSALTILP